MGSLKYDTSAKTLYVKIGRGKVARTEPLDDSIFFDLDNKGKLVGIEVIFPRDVPPELVKKIAAVA